jgi:predicted GIY-YIG superfamily endonuclease
MQQNPRTIQIYLPFGDPASIRIAEITTSVLRVIEIPRSLLSKSYEMPELNQVGVYFLLGEDDEGNSSLYIGQTSELKKRLVQHDKNKEFWSRAVVVVSLTNNITQTHAVYLEWLAISRANKAQRYKLENSTSGSKPHTPAPMEEDCKLYHGLIEILLGTLGFPVFKPLVSKSIVKKDEFFCTRSGADGRGIYTDEGFVVIKGSICSESTSKSFKTNGYSNLRNKLIETGVITTANNKIIFHKDYLFKSPSAASAVLIGTASNGWKDWKSNEGKTLDELKRVFDEENL